MDGQSYETIKLYLEERIADSLMVSFVPNKTIPQDVLFQMAEQTLGKLGQQHVRCLWYELQGLKEIYGDSYES